MASDLYFSNLKFIDFGSISFNNELSTNKIDIYTAPEVQQKLLYIKCN